MELDTVCLVQIMKSVPPGVVFASVESLLCRDWGRVGARHIWVDGDVSWLLGVIQDRMPNLKRLWLPSLGSDAV